MAVIKGELSSLRPRVALQNPVRFRLCSTGRPMFDSREAQLSRRQGGLAINFEVHRGCWFRPQMRTHQAHCSIAYLMPPIDSIENP
jgi:hypothetical protein